MSHPPTCSAFCDRVEGYPRSDGIGAERKEARLRYLRNRWAKRFIGQKGVQMFTSLDPAQSCGIGTVGIEGIDNGELVTHLASLISRCTSSLSPLEHSCDLNQE